VAQDRLAVRLPAFIAMVVLGHLGIVGARMTTSLFALKLGASAFTVGLLLALFAVLPMLLSVSAGRFIDRAGTVRPLLASYAVLALSIALPYAWPRLETLYFSSTLAGTAFMVLHIAVNSATGAFGKPEDRPVNFSWLSLGFSTSGSLAPLVAGFAIDGLGHAKAFGVLALFPFAGLLLLWTQRHALPRPERSSHGGAARKVLDLLRVPALRRVFMASGALAIGWDLYTFLLPLYGARIGLSAVTIGTIMSTFAGATFAVRLVIPALVRRLRDWQVIATALAVSGASYLLFHFVSGAAPLMAISFLLGIGLGCAQPFIMSRLINTAPPGRQGEVVGVRILMLSASQTFIPVLSGAFSTLFGMAPVFWLVAVLLLAGGWAARGRARAPAAP
jgi:predicted MFS family arabinose efflux permease